MKKKTEIGKRIRDAREEAGLSQTDLQSIVFGTKGHAQVWAIEKGKRDVTVGELEKIAETTGKHITWFFEKEEYPDLLVPSFNESLGGAELPILLTSLELNVDRGLLMRDDTKPYMEYYPSKIAQGASHALTIRGWSLAPQFKDGDMIFINTPAPDEKPKEGSLVVAKMPDGHMTLNCIFYIKGKIGFGKKLPSAVLYDEKDIGLIGVVLRIVKKNK